MNKQIIFSGFATILLLVLLMVSNNSFGQSNPIGKGIAFPGDLYHNGGNFGLGTTSPQKHLHVSSFSSQPTIRLSYSLAEKSFFNWDISGSENLSFKYGNSEITTTQMLLTRTGQLTLSSESPDASAIFQTDATNRGILIPRLTTAEKNAITSPANGLFVYDKDINVFSYYDSGIWYNIVESSQLDDYLLEEDFNNHPASNITTENITNWNEAYNWGNHSVLGYLTEEADPIFNLHLASDIEITDTTRWGTAFTWGDHSTFDYITDYTETDPQVADDISINYTAK